jgi:23S rRNA pseudouridine2605 synthase
MKKIRLSKVLAASGVASRRACEKIITDGRVTVNGEKALLPQTLVDPESDLIEIDGQKIKKKPEKVYFLLHKPIGYVCTNDPKIKRRAIDLIPYEGRLFTIGRLDKDTSGLILLTNDGHFAHKVMHPSGGIHKEYLVKVNKELSHQDLVTLSKGCIIEGRRASPLSVSKVRHGTMKIVVQEGRHHEVRALVAAADMEVLELKRIRIGPLLLGKLPVGECKRLSQSEIAALF